MPDFWTHILGGELILKDIDDENIRDKIINNRKLFYLGCQGPDLFYYNDFWPWIKEKRGPEAGRKIHQNDFRSFFSSSIDFIRLEKNEKLNVYFYGVLCHYVFDRYLHPYINECTASYHDHKVMEMELDVFLVDKLWKEKAYRLSPLEAVDIGEHLPAAVEEYYRYILSALFSYSPEIDFIDDSYRDMKRVLSIFFCPDKYKWWWLKFLNKLMPLDISIYLYPRELNEKFFTEQEKHEIYMLFNRARREGSGLIKMLDSEISAELIKFLPQVSFAGS